MSKNFDPLLTRKEQNLKPLPSWLFSLAEQRAMLLSKGLHEITTSNKRGVWTVVKRVSITGSIESQPTLDKNENDLRGDRKWGLESVDNDQVTLGERKSNDARIASKLKIVREYKTRVK